MTGKGRKKNTKEYIATNSTKATEEAVIENITHENTKTKKEIRMTSEHKSLMTSATTFSCFTPLTVMSIMTSPIIVANCFLFARGMVRCFGNKSNFSLFVVDSLMKVPELPVSIIALVVLPSTLHLVYDTFLLPSQANAGGD